MVGPSSAEVAAQSPQQKNLAGSQQVSYERASLYTNSGILTSQNRLVGSGGNSKRSMVAIAASYTSLVIIYYSSTPNRSR